MAWSYEVAAEAEPELPKKPGKGLLITALIVMLAVPVGCIIGIMALAGPAFGEVSQFSAYTDMKLSLDSSSDYLIIHGEQSEFTCLVNGPSGSRVDVDHSPVRLLGRSMAGAAFATQESGRYNIRCVPKDQAVQLFTLMPAGMVGASIAIVFLALGAIICFVTGGILVIVAVLVRRKARRRYEAELAQYAAEMDRYASHQPVTPRIPGPPSRPTTPVARPAPATPPATTPAGATPVYTAPAGAASAYTAGNVPAANPAYPIVATPAAPANPVGINPTTPAYPSTAGPAGTPVYPTSTVPAATSAYPVGTIPAAASPVYPATTVPVGTTPIFPTGAVPAAPSPVSPTSNIPSTTPVYPAGTTPATAYPVTSAPLGTTPVYPAAAPAASPAYPTVATPAGTPIYSAGTVPAATPTYPNTGSTGINPTYPTTGVTPYRTAATPSYLATAPSTASPTVPTQPAHQFLPPGVTPAGAQPAEPAPIAYSPTGLPIYPDSNR